MEQRSRELGSLDPRLPGRRTHLCVSCQFPIAVYGRCAPCLHVFCLTCAADMPACAICNTQITKLERVQAGTPIFISPATLQGFRSQADLAKHAQQLQGQIQLLMSGAHPLLAQLQAQAMIQQQGQHYAAEQQQQQELMQQQQQHQQQQQQQQMQLQQQLMAAYLQQGQQPPASGQRRQAQH